MSSEARKTVEDLFIELSEFTSKNRNLFNSAEKWLNEFEGDLDDAWGDAICPLGRDWLKIILVASRIYEKGIEYLLNAVLVGEYTTEHHPNLFLLKIALGEVKKANQKNPNREPERRK